MNITNTPLSFEPQVTESLTGSNSEKLILLISDSLESANEDFCFTFALDELMD